MIKNCFIDEQPDFYQDVKVDGDKIATVKALTKNDLAKIEDKCYEKKLVDGEIDINFNMQKVQLLQIKLALTGDDKVGWETEREVTEKNIGLLEDKYFNALSDAVSGISEADKDVQKTKASCPVHSAK